MNCSKSEQWIQDSLDGLLNAAQRAELEDHLAVCASCRAAFDEYRHLGQAAKAWAAPEPDDPERSAAFLAAVLKAAKNAPVSKPAAPAWVRISVVLGAAATFAAAAYFEPSLGAAAAQISLPLPPVQTANAFIAFVQAIPNDALQAANAATNANPTHLPLDLIAVGAVTVNALFLLRALVEGKYGGSRRVNG